MNFNEHLNLNGCHAFLGASRYHWINYDRDKLELMYRNFLSIQKGIELHDLAQKCIKANERLEKTQKTLSMFVNDAIGFKMKTEQKLYYSDNCYGTADAISFRNNTLRIHDLKTGRIPAHMEQLEIYAALFCLEYRFNPSDIDIELRIYQNNEVLCHKPEAKEILRIMDKIVESDRIIDKIKSQEG